MKYILRLTALILLPLFGFAEEGFVIKGKITGIISGSVSVAPQGKDENAVISPKVRIENGEFTYTGKIDHPQFVVLKISTKRISVFLENASYTVNGDFSKLTVESVKGGTLNGQYLDWAKSGKSVKEYLKENNGTLLAPFLAYRLAYTHENTIEAYNLLTAEGKRSYYGKLVKENLDNYEKNAAGKRMKDFKMTDPDGKEVSIKDFAGKIVVMDFWASWCAPCIAYIPKMREHYNKYKDQGVVFVSVSIDEDEIRWKRAMNEQQMEWKQVITPGGLSKEEGVTPLFNITSIPYLMIVDQQGMIAAPLDAYHKDEMEKVIEKLIKK
jgi:peroxiredoxin